jgi:lipopolysaccharide export system protein LptA
MKEILLNISLLCMLFSLTLSGAIMVIKYAQNSKTESSERIIDNWKYAFSTYSVKPIKKKGKRVHYNYPRR